MALNYWGISDDEVTEVTRKACSYLSQIDVDNPEEAKARISSLMIWLQSWHEGDE